MMALARIGSSSSNAILRRASTSSVSFDPLRPLFATTARGQGIEEGRLPHHRHFSNAALPCTNQSEPQLDNCSLIARSLDALPSNFALGLQRHSGRLHHVRSYSTAPVKQDEYNEIVEEINSKFADAREEIELAAESKETVYFNDEAENAKTAVKVVLDLYNGLLNRLSESERGSLQRSMGLKMEQLKAELAQLNE